MAGMLAIVCDVLFEPWRKVRVRVQHGRHFAIAETHACDIDIDIDSINMNDMSVI